MNRLCLLAYLEIRWISSVRQDLFSLFLKPPKLSFPLLFSLDLLTVVLSLLAVLRFSLLQFTEWSDAQLTSSSKLLSLPTSLFYLMISTAHWLPISSRTQKQSSSHLLSPCLWYSSSIPLLVASSLLFLRCLHSASDTWLFHVHRMGRKTVGDRSFHYIGPLIWN